MMESYRLLIVEDDSAVAETVIELFENAHYSVKWAATGVDALQAVAQFEPHIIILDINLPDMLGFDVCATLREQRHLQPILILTVSDSDIDKIIGFERGADDYLTKPFSISELRSRIQAMLRRAYGKFAVSEQENIYIADLVINKLNATVRRGDTIISLTPTEFRILHFLAQHPEQTLSRRQILDHVWAGSPDNESENGVSVHIRRLRSKIELDPGQPRYVLTVPGFGYRLETP